MDTTLVWYLSINKPTLWILVSLVQVTCKWLFSSAVYMYVIFSFSLFNFSLESWKHSQTQSSGCRRRSLAISLLKTWTINCLYQIYFSTICVFVKYWYFLLHQFQSVSASCSLLRAHSNFAFSGIMVSIKDWIFSQLVSKSFASARPLSGGTFFEEESFHDEFGDRGSYLNTTVNDSSIKQYINVNSISA